MDTALIMLANEQDDKKLSHALYLVIFFFPSVLSFSSVSTLRVNSDQSFDVGKLVELS